MCQLKKLEKLTISHSPGFTGRDLRQAAWLASIQKVDFLYATLDDDALRVLAEGPRIRAVRVEGTPIDADGLRALVSVRNLVELGVGNCRNLSEQDFVELLPQFTRLTKLDLVGSRIGAPTVEALATLTNLVDLNLFGTRVGDGELAMLARLPALETLYIGASRVTDEGVMEFKRSHPRCRIER